MGRTKTKIIISVFSKGQNVEVQKIIKEIIESNDLVFPNSKQIEILKENFPAF